MILHGCLELPEEIVMILCGLLLELLKLMFMILFVILELLSTRNFYDTVFFFRVACFDTLWSF